MFVSNEEILPTFHWRLVEGSRRMSVSVKGIVAASFEVLGARARGPVEGEKTPSPGRGTFEVGV